MSWPAPLWESARVGLGATISTTGKGPHWLCGLVAAALLATVGAPSFAQESGASSADLEILDEDTLDDEDLFGDEELSEDDDLFGVTPEEPSLDAAAAEPEVVLEPEAGSAESDVLDPALRPPSSDIEEILIQGERGQGLEIDAATSATSFDAADLEAMGVGDVSDIASFTPNLEIRTAGATTPTFFIRGVGLNDFTANASGAVAIYQDDVALDLPALQLGQIFDVENVEVLRGPQGTGAGRNASAGAIKIYSRKPSGEMGGFIRADYGRFDFVDLEGALEVPLFRDLLSTRAAFRLSQREGIMHNRCGGSPLNSNQTRMLRPPRSVCDESQFALPGGLPLVPAGLETDLNDTDTWAARGQLRFLPPDTDMEWLLNLHGGRVDQLGQVGQALGTNENFLGSSTSQPAYNQQEIEDEFRQILLAQGGFSPEALARSRRILAKRLAKRPLDRKPFQGDYNLPGFERQDSYGVSLRGEWELPNVSVSSITGYEHYDRERLIDADYTSNRIFEFAIEDDSYQVTQDLTFAGELDDVALGWDAGAFFLTRELDYQQNTLASGDIRGLIQEYGETVWSFGIFSGFEWKFADDFELAGGVRFNWERKRFDVETITTTLNRCLNADTSCNAHVTESAPTGTLSLKYFFNDDVSAYAKYSRGWKGPQYNVGDSADTGSTSAITRADPESIDAFEAGFAGAWFDGRLELKGALFWYRYQDYQVFLITNDFGSPPQRRVENANDARVYGAELEGTLEPLERLVLNARFGWIESRFLDFTRSNVRIVRSQGNPPPPPRIFEVPIQYTGNRLPNTPRFKLSVNTEYTIELGRYGSLSPRYDFTWTDDVFFDPSEGRGAPNNDAELFLPDYTIGQKAHWLHNARLTYRTPGGNLELSGWVRNFTNETYKSLAFDASAAAGLIGNLLGDPRTYGASVTVSF